MNYFRAPLADRLAAEYVLGTLRGAARRRFDALLPAHPALRGAVARWQDALLPLAASVPPVHPSPQVWRRIEARLFGEAAGAAGAAARAGAPGRWWHRLGAWRAATGVSAALALALGVALTLPPPPAAPIVIVMSPNDAAGAGAELLAKATFVASVSADGRALVVRPLTTVPLSPDRALELWAVPPEGAPRSLGLVASDHASRVLRANLLNHTAALAVSVEPAGGSTTGAPTGPVISVGKLES